MGLEKYESQVKHVAYAVDKVYAALSNFDNLKTLNERLSSEETRQKLADSIGEERAAQALQAIENMEITPDSITIQAPMVGRVTLKAVEREDPKLIKIASVGLPVQVYLWMQMLPEGSEACKLKVTAGADVNFLTKGLAGQYLPGGAEKLAEILAALPYDKI